MNDLQILVTAVAYIVIRSTNTGVIINTTHVGKVKKLVKCEVINRAISILE